MGELHKVGQVSDLGPGKIKATQVGSEYVAVTQVDGQVYAFDDTCSHAACSISPGEVEDYLAPCYCHGALFDVRTGAAVQGPAGRPVQTFPVKVEGDDVLVEL